MIREVKELSLKFLMGIARLAGRSRFDWRALKRRHSAARPTWCFGNGFKPQMCSNHTQKSRVSRQSTSKCANEPRGHVWNAKTKSEEGSLEFRNLTPKGVKTAFHSPPNEFPQNVPQIYQLARMKTKHVCAKRNLRTRPPSTRSDRF